MDYKFQYIVLLSKKIIINIYKYKFYNKISYFEKVSEVINSLMILEMH